MKDFIIRGSVFDNGRMESGTFSILKEKFIDNSATPIMEGTLMRAPINFHTHLGDSFIGTEPEGDIEEIVGPGGFKIKALDEARPSVVKSYIRKSIDFMKDRGTAAFFDFRESGIRGLRLAPKVEGINGFFLTRPDTPQEVNPLLDQSAGFGMSAISDYDFRYLEDLSKQARRKGKLFAIHFSENKRENVRRLLALRPDYVIHCIETSDSDLSYLRKRGIPVSITPRSNIFHGKRPDYSRLFNEGLTVTLGTDNVFITEPDVFAEAEFLYRYQRKLRRLSPEQVLSTITDNPRRVMKKLDIKMKEEKFLFFPNEFLTPYQLVTRPNYFSKIIVTKKGNGITFFPSKH
ncbi:MAG: amidohydrolase family protein [Thermoplasmata archaeon]